MVRAGPPSSSGRATIAADTSTARRMSHRPAEPVLEARRSDPCVACRRERMILEVCPEIARVRIRGHRTRVVLRAQNPSSELVEPELLGAAELHDPVHGVV